MNNYVIDPFIYNPPNADPRELFSVIEYEDIAKGRYLISIYGRVYDAMYDGFLPKKQIKHRTWTGSTFFENYCLFDTDDHTTVYKSVPKIELAMFKGYAEGYRIMHANGDTLDDNLYNLFYGDYVDIEDRVYLPKYRKERITSSKTQDRVSDEQIELVCKLLEKNIHPSMIAEKLDIRWRDVYNIKTLRLGNKISKKYSFKTNRGGIFDYDKYDEVARELGIIED